MIDPWYHPEPEYTTEPINYSIKMTKLHHQIVQHLLPVCLATTQAMRKKFGDVTLEDKLTDKLKEQNKKKWGIIDDNYKRFVYETLAEVTGKPELLTIMNSGSSIIYDPLSIVIVVNNENGNLVGQGLADLKAGYIVMHGANHRFLDKGGRFDRTAFNYYEDQPACVRLATDTEVEITLESLNPAQIRTVLSNDIFAAALAPLLEEVYDEKKDEAEKGKEASTLDELLKK